jgi:hypothetical protein
MAKFKLKLDTTKIKEFVTERYEMIALGVGGFLALICLFAGCSTFFGASSPDQQIEQTAKGVEDKRMSNPPPPPSEGQTPRPAIKTTVWGTIANQEARFDINRALFDDGAAGDNRRFQPVIKAMDSDPKSFQLDYIRRGVYVYYSQDSKKMLGVFKSQEGAQTQPQVPQPPLQPGMQGKQGQQGQLIDPVFHVADKRLVVVSGTFPYFEQAELYRKALRFDRLEDMFAAGLAPTFEGLIVERRKITKEDGKEKIGEWEGVYKFDYATGKTEPSPAVAKLLETCIYDVNQAEKYAEVIFGATVTPLPLIASFNNKGDYPEIKIPDIAKAITAVPTPTPGPGEMPRSPGGAATTLGRPPGGMPTTPGGGAARIGGGFGQGKPGGGFGPGGPAAGANQMPVGRLRDLYYPNPTSQDRKIEFKDYEVLPQDLKDQLNGNLNWTSPYGTFVDEPDKADDGNPPTDPAGEPKKQPMRQGRLPGVPPPGIGQPGAGPSDQYSNLKAPTVPPASPKALVRFVDCDVTPGAEYQYRIAVRIANPNYNLSTKVVANPGWTKNKEFVTDWVETPRISIPEEFHFYVINQNSGFFNRTGLKWDRNPNKNVTIDLTPAQQLGDRVPFQLHKFIGTFTTNDTVSHYVAEWEVAERVLAGKGETIGRDVEVEAIAWNPGRSQFEFASTSPGKVRPGTAKAVLPGVPVDFRPNQPIILLDFAGGKVSYQPKAGSPITDMDSATEALIAMPDGSLIVRNSRHDMDDRGWNKGDTDLGGHKNGIERRQRMEEWKTRLEDFRQQVATQPKDNNPYPNSKMKGGN